MKEIDGKTKAICLLGDPVEHSLSPLIHNYGFEKEGLNYVYINHRIGEKDLSTAVEGLRVLGYIGCNVTFPHKIAIMQYLDQLSPEVNLIGAVNTVKNEKGRLIGYNTDGKGYIKGLERKGIQLAGKRITILGAGGAAKSIAVALRMEYDCEITICNRRRDKSIEIIDVLEKIDKASIEKNQAIAPEDLATYPIDILINCTPVGMVPNTKDVPFQEHLNLHKDMVVSDIIYHPFETQLLKEALKVGATIHHGLDMLIDQGILAFEIWTRQKLSFETIKELLQKKLYSD
ncbi:shikimate dehydrogenase [Natronincola peptidivorans]|uniref:Shikimate dehydrogenase (NADP(+)) n=1 Tax=Natronincola peptidivorans TaxID=426128 RepID=A0A1H9YR19_9FIRM|nr:shikimate dehydrogenase [Natronincola peptidivorans]SES71606.1 shikimate dehydrogenase [Natronincola peptidivorans]